MAQGAQTRIEKLAPGLDGIVSTEPIRIWQTASAGSRARPKARCGGSEGGYLLFSDIHNNKRMKYEPGKGASLFLEPTNRANGLTRDLQGRLLACEHDSRRVTRLGAGRQPRPSSATAFRAASSTGPTMSSSNPTVHLFHRSVDQPERAAANGI